MRLKLRRSNDDDLPFHDDDTVNTSIIDALKDMPPAYGGTWDQVTVNPGTMPIAHVNPKPNPPSRHSRPELHITGPQRSRPYVAAHDGKTPPDGVPVVRRPRPSRGRVLKVSRATLPIFHETARVLGWRAFIPPKKPALSFTGALRSIDAYCDKTMRVVCQQVGYAKGELWERARDYDLKEAELRAQRPLARQTGM